MSLSVVYILVSNQLAIKTLYGY